MASNVLDKIGSNIKKKIEENKKEVGKEIKVSAKNEILILENDRFDYNEVEKEVADYLIEKELSIKNVVSRAYTEIGEILSEAQEKLSNHSGGIFEKWYESLGFKKDKVYRLISRYKLVLANCENRILIENLPLSLSYEISKESCPEELKDKVLNGEIKTLKEFNEAKELEKTEKKQKIIDNEALKSKIFTFEKKYEFYKEKLFENIDNYEEDKKAMVVKEIKRFEKNIEKIIGK